MQEAFDLDVVVHENEQDTNNLNLNLCTRLVLQKIHLKIFFYV